MPLAEQPELDLDEPDEHGIVEAWRLQQLIDAGFTFHRANQIAERTDIDLHRATDLIHNGCPEHIALLILL